MSRDEVTHKINTFLHYVRKHPFAGISKIDVHSKTLVLKSFIIRTANLQFATALKNTLVQVLSREF